MANRKPAPKKPAPAKKASADRVKPGTTKEAAETRKRMFAEAYIANGENATDAARAAGFSAHTAGSQGSRLLKDLKVQALIAERRAQLLNKLELTTEAVLRNLAQAVYFDPRKLFHQDGRAKLPHELDDDTAAAINGMEVEVLGGKVTGMKFKAVEKNAARDQAMKHLGLFKADNTQRTLLGDVPREKLKAIVARLAGG